MNFIPGVPGNPRRRPARGWREAVMAEFPEITEQHVYGLLDAPHERPVLYVQNGPDDDGSGPLKLEVWAEALVPHDSIVLRREEYVDSYGSDPSPEDVEGQLPDLQQSVDEVCEGLLAQY